MFIYKTIRLYGFYQMLRNVTSGGGEDVFGVEVFVRVHVATSDRGWVVDEPESEKN